MNAPTIVVLAAGQGTRMRSAVPKVLHELCGRPMGLWPVVAALEAGAGKVVVVDSPARPLAQVLPEVVQLVVQPVSNGTGGAVVAAAGEIDPDAAVVVLSGDVPLVSASAIAELVDAHARGGAAATMATTVLDDPSGYGRVVRDGDGSVARVVETKKEGDATAAELQIREVNTGIYAFAGASLLRALPRLSADNAQGELYLPQVLDLLRAEGERVLAHAVDDPNLVLGVNDRTALAQVRAIAQRAILDQHMRAGVTIVDPAATYVDVDVRIGRDARIEPGSSLRGATELGEGAVVGPHSTLTDSLLGEQAVVGSHTTVTDTAIAEHATVGPHTTAIGCAIGARAKVRVAWLERARVHADASVGPFAYLRPDAVLGEGAKVGTFVEVKSSNIGAGTKIPHLSYIGDADVGERANLGAGTITANYDGHAKHRTTIGSGVRGGVDTAFIAPVTVGDDAWTAAGSVITEDVPAGALGVARARQQNREGYAQRREEQRQARDAPSSDTMSDAPQPVAAPARADDPPPSP
ncbi:MAG TPA: NTP transferase domain-containing protein [Solirubrobacteraceae bacterium]|jgi:bifunctional UDP-N-acetylglucosamine pyrophosphorylase/glucosamine-1-phosphate N-acetyltransferase|nr:NTP transferase domain-containing protein [Solirubrobacteraceae bacterium]